MVAWLSLIAFGIILAAAVFLEGGVYAGQWHVLALAIADCALIHAVFTRRVERPAPDLRFTVLWSSLIAWVICQIIPWPPPLIQRLSPERFHILQNASAVLGMPRFIQSSEAPGETFEHLTRLTAYAACFFLARCLAWRFRRRLWLVVAPVVLIAGLEALLGISQVFLAGQPVLSGVARGTYVNRNHFAWLLEMALPLTLLGAVAVWRTGRGSGGQSVSRAFWTGTLLLSAGALLVAIVFSLSRTGFAAALISVLVAGVILITSRTTGGAWTKGWKRWAPLTAFPVALFSAILFLPPDQLIARLASVASADELSTEGRIQIWQDSVQLARHYPVTGCGLGAYEVALYPWKTAGATFRVDHAHNDYLQLVAELGIPGSIIVFTLALMIGGRILRFAFTSKNAPGWELAVGLCASFTAVALHSVTDFNLYIPSNALAFTWLAGTAASPVFGRPRVKPARETQRLGPHEKTAIESAYDTIHLAITRLRLFHSSLVDQCSC